MSDLYTAEGWVNAQLLTRSRAPFVIAVGGRGIGKTYGVLDELLQIGEPFIYLRRTQVQIDACKVPELSPFNAVCRNRGIIIESGTISKYVAGFHRVNGEEKTLVALGIALSTFANVRGFDASGYKYCVFDEFIPERHERPIPHEGEAFLNVLETINRNRELLGEDPIHVIMLSNANKLDSPILASIGALQPLDRMTKAGRDWGRWYDGALEIFRYIDSPISERKRSGALYRLANNEDFTGMALDNSFSGDTYYNVCSKPIREYEAVASAKGITVYRHKSNGSYYVVPGIRSENVYTSSPEQMRAFCRRCAGSYEAMCRGDVYYASAEAKVIYEAIWR